MASTPGELITAILDTLPAPPREFFADLSGDPLDNIQENQQEALAFFTTTAEKLRLLITLLTAANEGDEATPIDLSLPLDFQYKHHHRRDNDNIIGDHSRKTTNEPLRSGILIEEIPLSSGSDAGAEVEAESSTLHLPLLVRLALAASTYASPRNTPRMRAPAMTTTTKTAFNSNKEACKAADAILTFIHRSSSTTNGTNVGDILYACIECTEVSKTLTACAHHGATETSRLEPYTGPDVFERCHAAHQLYYILTTFVPNPSYTNEFDDVDKKDAGDEYSSYVQTMLVPLLLATLQDPSPLVQRYVLLSLQHIIDASAAAAAAADGGELSECMPSLIEGVKKAVIGCDQRSWSAAASAACSIAAKSTPKNFMTLFDALMEEGERHAHVPDRSVVWLSTVPYTFFMPLGIRLALYFKRLMPLVLDWCVAIQKDVRLNALKALHVVVRATWPRMLPHVRVLWSVMHTVYEDEVRFSAKTVDDILQSCIDVGVVLYEIVNTTVSTENVEAWLGEDNGADTYMARVQEQWNRNNDDDTND